MKFRNCLFAAAMSASAIIVSTSISTADTYTLRIGAGHPAVLGYVVAAKDYLIPESTRRVKQQTGHELKWVEGYGGTIAKIPEILESTQQGILDVGLTSYSYEPSNLFLHSIGFYVPFNEPDPAKSLIAMRKVYDEMPYFTEIFEEKFGQKFLALGTFADYGIGMNFDFENFEDMKGKKLGVAGPNAAWLKNTGATPVVTNLTETYNAMQTGVYDGIVIFPGPYFNFKLHEVGNYFLLARLGSPSATGLTINANTWNKLPPEVREIITQVAKESELHGAYFEAKSNLIGVQRLNDAGVVVREISDEARKKWATALKDFPNEKAKEADAKGQPGSQAFRSLFKHVKAGGYEYPVEYEIK